jgi:uncharacterized damage-inducible protein DinB
MALSHHTEDIPMTAISACALLREQLVDAHQQLDQLLADVTAEQAHWTPPGKAHPIGALSAHILLYEDLILRFLVGGQPPLFLGEWADRVGASELPPLPNPETGIPDWSAWARQARFDLDQLRAYGQAVYASSDATLAALGDADLARSVDLGWLGLGQPPLRWLISTFVIAHANAHTGEISAVKGLQGLRGYVI